MKIVELIASLHTRVTKYGDMDICVMGEDGVHDIAGVVVFENGSGLFKKPYALIGDEHVIQDFENGDL